MRNGDLPMYSLTCAQNRIWFGEQDRPGTPFANLGFIVRFRHPVDPALLERAIGGLLERHDGLRLRIASMERNNDDETMQYVTAFAPEPFECLDFSGPDGEERLAQWSGEQVRIPFTRHDAPLYRFVILKLGEGMWGYFMNLHHLVADGWTVGLVIHEIRTELLGGSNPAAPPSYCDYIAAESSYLASPEYEADRSFWTQRLKSVPTPSDLHASARKDAGNRSRRLHIHFPDTLRTRIRKYCRAEPTTLFRVCLGALYVYMTRALDRYDVTISTVSHCRTTAVQRRMAGMFVGTFPLRLRVPGEGTFRELMAVLRDDVREILAHHQRYPYEDLMRDMRTAGVDPGALASVYVVGHPERFPDDLSVTYLDNGHEPAALSLHVYNDGEHGWGGGDLVIDSQVDLFTPDEVAGLTRTLLTILDEATRAPDTRLAELDLLSPGEKQQILIEWNATATPVPDICVHRLFEAQAHETPDALAVVFEGEQLSYAELNARANQLAHHLRKVGVGPDALVAICVERSLEMVVGLLGILKAGGAYVPLDPSYPVERLVYMIEDSSPVVVLTHRHVAELVRASLSTALAEGSSLIDLDADAWRWESAPESNIDVASIGLTPEHLAYVIYTSGSTGLPKGVMIEHGSLTSFLWTMIRELSADRTDSFLALTTLSFDIAALELYLPLVVGGSMVLATTEHAHDPLHLAALIDRHRSTFMQATPATWRMLLDSGWRGCASVKLLCGGETMPAGLAQSLVSCCGTLWNVYGPTEATVWASLLEICPSIAESLLPGHSAPIGRPLANTRMYLLDRHGQPVPIGMPGELYIGGVQVARGYLNRPELTAEKFIPDPFSDEPGARLYKTGDLARYLPDGTIEFLGRIDHQVKIRGFRIELGEIEAVLAGHPDIREAVVAARGEESGRRLIAYLVAGQRPDTDTLRAFLKNTLPDYMIPAAFVFLDALPLTPNGKVDRRALPEPEVRPDGAGYLPPRDGVEQQLVEIWEALLGARPIGIEDNFFDLGGHSLLAVRLVAAMNKQFGQNLPVSRLFESPTIAGIASLLRKTGNLPATSCLVRIRPQGARQPLFFLPGAASLIGYLYPLANQLDPEIPIVAFQARGMDGKEAPHTDLDEMAAHYVALLRGAQPEGPYYLAGHSFGAIAAFAMAQVLLAQGQEIGLLAIVDTHAPTGVAGDIDERLTDEIWRMVIIGQLLSLLFDRDISLELEDIAGLTKQEQLVFVARKLAEAHLLPEDDVVDHLRGIIDVYTSNMAMQKQYVPRSPLPVPVALFRSTEELRYLPSPRLFEGDLGWGRYARLPVPVHHLPGNHVTMMMQPHVQDLARVLISEIRRHHD